MSSRVDQANRTLLILLGLLLLLGGGAGLALSFGAFGAQNAATPVIADELSRFIADNWWYWWAVAALATIVALIMVRWLLAQLHTSRLSHLDVEPDRSNGETVLRGGAIADGVEHEVRGFLGVKDASLQLQGNPASHRYHLTVDLDPRADVDAVRGRLTTHTVPNIRRALDFEDPVIAIRLVLADRTRRRLS